MFRMDRRHKEKAGRRELRTPVYTQNAEKPVVKIELGASRAADRRRKNDAGGVGSLQSGAASGSAAHAHSNAPGAGARVSQAERGMGQLSKVSTRLPPHHGRMGGHC